MTARNPLVLVAGKVSELPAGDTVNGAVSGGGVSGQASLSGAFPGVTTAQVGALRFYPRSVMSVTSIFASLSANATTAVVAAIRKNGVVVQTVTIAAGASTATQASVFSVLATDYLTMDIVSGTGYDLALRVDYDSVTGSVYAGFPGATIAQVGTMRYYPRTSITVTSIFASLSMNATTAVTAAVRKNGVVVQTVTIAAGASTATQLTSFTAAPTDYLTMDIQSGDGRDLSLRLDY